MTNEEIIERVLADEGGGKFVCNPADPGGATKWGITGPAFRDWFRARTGQAYPAGRAIAEDIRSLEHADAVEFYAWLLESTRIGKIANDTLRWVVFDAAVHVGATQAVKFLQRAVGAKDDGVLGPVTLGALPVLQAERLVRLYLRQQMLFYGRLAAGNLTDADRDGIPDQLEFLPGYLERLGRKMEAAA